MMTAFNLLKRRGLAWAAAVCLLLPGWLQATPVDVSRPRAAIPPNVVTTSNRPMVMLAVSKDHSLFGPIYTDFEDLDDDGQIDTTFIPTFKYYGYFDSTKCYVYSNTDARYNPAANATIVPTTVGSKTLDRYTCASSASQWSGNFLNWATMTRLDVVRKMLYGGNRYTDTNGTTVLEGPDLNWDAHSFVKYYRGTDIRDYTPFTTAALTKTTGANANVYAGLSICTTGYADSTTGTRPVMRLVKGNVRFWSTVEIEVCRWSEDYNKGTFGSKLAAYYKDADKGGGGISHELTIPSKSTDGATYGSTIGPELNVRVKVCDPSWLGEERCQAFPVSSTTNYKPYGLLQEFGYPANSGGAARAEFGLITGSYDLNHTAGALRKNMSDFADEINPTTGVFCHSASSGCSTTLADGRATGKGAIKALDAILLYGRTSQTYGSGNTPSASADGNLPVWGNPIGEMVVQALQYYAYNGSTPAPTNPTTTTNDTTAGMPVVAWKDPLTNTYTTRTNLYGNAICRPMHVLALSPSALSFDGQAATPFATLPNRALGALDSYTDLIGTTEGLAGTLRSVGSVSGKGLTTADDQNSCAAKTVGLLSNVNGLCPEAPAMGGTYQVAGAALYGNTSKIRTVTTVPSDLKYVEGALKVRTLAASLTGGAPRVEVPLPGTDPVKYVYITPESVQTGGKVSAPLTFVSVNSFKTTSTLSTLSNGDTAAWGSFLVTWNDILMGGDYDMDITGFLRYDVVRNSATPSGWDIKVTTDIPSVCGGAAGTHGFSIIGVQTAAGVNANGRYLTHQHTGSATSYSLLPGMPGSTEYLCSDSTYRAKTSTLFSGTYGTTVCSVTGANYCTVKTTPYPHSMTFRMVGESNVLIKDPLWYAGKYGYFKSSTKNADGTYTDVALPTTQSSWDSVKSDGTYGSDGIPDGYFLARRPEVLEAQLRRALTDLSGKSNASPAVSSSQLMIGSLRYDVSFDPNTYDGNLEAYAVNDQGAFSSTPSWRAGQLLGCRTKGPCAGVSADAGDSRQIITNYGNGTGAGVKFRWANLPLGYQTQMSSSSTNVLSTATAQVTLAYVRGDQSKESATQLRERGANVLGPIVSSTPSLQTPPAANYFGSAFSGYTDFAKANKDRSKLLWVGSNDGMLHAFEPLTGAEVFAYVPGALANRLAEIPLQRSTASGAITSLNGSAYVNGTEARPDGTIWPYVDGSPFIGDVSLGAYSATATSAAWRTYLVSSLGRGGRAVFALDVTSYSKLQSGEGNAADIFRWQFTVDDDTDLGYIVNDFQVNENTRQPMPIAKLNNGKFAYLLGNGYQSSNGKAALFIVFADGPTGTGGTWVSGRDYIKIVADAGPSNGLSQVMWQDLDSNGTADVVYAGDLQGNLWKFDLSSTTSTQWGVAYTSSGVNKPLFTAKSGTDGNGSTRLPITTVPQYAYGTFDGSVILFGTGSAFESADYPNTGVSQRFYGIWDRPVFKTGGRALPTNLSTLVGRTLTRQTDGSITLSGTVTDVDWATQDGWYVTFPGSSEMNISDPIVRARTLIFTTIRPPQTGTYCATRPDATLFAMDTLSGSVKRTLLGNYVSGSDTLKTLGTSILDQKVKFLGDRTGAAFRTKETCVAGTPGCVCTGSTCVKPVVPTCGSGQKAPRVVGPNTSKTLCFNSNPRKQWREIPGLRTDK